MRRHHPVVRVTHWINVVAVTIMIGSGLRIFNAYPAFARRGERFCCYPFEHKPIPEWLTFGGWLAGARNWHFAMMWVLVVNGLVYLAWIWLHGEWRDLVPRRRDPRDAWEMMKFYLWVRPLHPRQGKHNALQKLAYFSMPAVAALAVLTGLAIWKPVQLAPLTAVFGGYVWARYVHFLAMLAIVVLVLGHIFMVMSVDPYSLRAMITGGYDPAISPEERNARPFYHLLPRRRSAVPLELRSRRGPGPAEVPAPPPQTVPGPAPGPAPAPEPPPSREPGTQPTPVPDPAPPPGTRPITDVAERPSALAPWPGARPAADGADRPSALEPAQPGTRPVTDVAEHANVVQQASPASGQIPDVVPAADPEPSRER